MRGPSTVVLVLAALVSFAGAARAGDAVVVLDRGRAAEARAGRWTGDAVRLAHALAARGDRVGLVAYGTRPDGRVRTATLAPDVDDDEIDRKTATREGLRFEGPTDPRRALALALLEREGAGPLLVFLVGPFAGAPDAEDDAAEAAATWREQAPAGSRVFPLGLDEGSRAAIEELPGVRVAATVVLGAGAAQAETTPYSPLAEPLVLQARVRVALDALLAGGGAAAPPLLASSSDGHGEVRAGAPEGGEATFDVTRAIAADDAHPRVETLAFSASADPAVLWLADVPQPRTIQWTTLAKDARLSCVVEGEGGRRTRHAGARPFVVEEALAGTPRRQVYEIEQTRVDDPVVWTCRAEEGELPDGMTCRVAEPLVLDAELASVRVEVAFEAQPGRPLEASGHLLIEAAGHPRRFRVPFRVVVPPGRVHVVLDAPPEPRRLPAGDAAPPWTFFVEEENPNAPPLVRVEAALEPADLARALDARLRGPGSVEVAWDLAQPLEVRPGRRYELRLDLAPGVRTARGTFALRLPGQRGVVGDARGRGIVEGRRPRLVVAEGAWAYRADGGEVVGDPPLALEVDPDGGGGPWRTGLFEIAPAVTVAPGAPVDFTLRAEGPGRWRLVPAGAWRGPRGNTFSARVDTVPVEVTWAGGRAPGRIEVAVEVRPRWGRAGWVLVGLAVLALALGVWGLLQLKAAPVAGTLLYQQAGREGAVGRLDLAPVGRRATRVTADEGGRLALGGAGDALLLVRPTRVGGLLELEGEEGAERHLLVDGLTVQKGAWRIRYVSPHPGEGRAPAAELEVEELLGPEFDLPTGRIGRLGRTDREGTGSPDGAREPLDRDAAPPDQRS